MIKTTLSVILTISITYLSSYVYAEEPFVAIGGVLATYNQEATSATNDAEVELENVKVTLGSRIHSNWIIEASYSYSNGPEIVPLGTAQTDTSFEFDSILSASINYTKMIGSTLIFIGPSVNWVQFSATSSALLTPFLPEIDQVGPGARIGIDFPLYKKLSVAVMGEVYLVESDYNASGAGAEFRYHL